MQHNPYLEDRALMHAEVQRSANHNAGRITTDCARAIASDWHNGQASALYAFASSGHFDGYALLHEIEAELARLLVPDDSTHSFSLHSDADIAALNALYRYVRDRAIA